MKNTFINIDITSDFNTSASSRAPIIKCFLNEHATDNLLKQYISEQFSLNEDEQNLEYLNQVKAIKNDLKSKLQKDETLSALMIIERIIARKFSGKSQSFAAITSAIQKVMNAASEHKPIIFTFGFGGYKSHTSKSYPYVDWAELFHMNFLVSYLYPIIKNYKYGVIIEYESEEIALKYNNYPQESLDKYTESFIRLINWYKYKAKEIYGLNLDIRLVFARDSYSIEKLENKIADLIPKYEQIWKDLSEEDKQKWLQRAEHNYIFDDNQHKITQQERFEIIKKSRLVNEAFLEADYELRIDFWECPTRISLVGTWGISASAQAIEYSIHIRSTMNSLVDFWIGTGVYKKKNDELSESILSDTQYIAAKEYIEYHDNNDEKLKEISPNFDKFMVLTAI